MASRTLTLVAMCLQKLANLVEFGAKVINDRSPFASLFLFSFSYQVSYKQTSELLTPF